MHVYIYISYEISASKHTHHFYNLDFLGGIFHHSMDTSKLQANLYAREL